MDLLSQYKQENPEASRPVITGQTGDEYSFFVRLVMKLSGGRVNDVQTATYVLLASAVVILLAAVIIFLFAGRPQGESRERLYPPGSPAI